MTTRTLFSGECATLRRWHARMVRASRASSDTFGVALALLAGCTACATNPSSSVVAPSPGMVHFTLLADTLFFARSVAFEDMSAGLRVVNTSGQRLFVDRCGNLSFPGFVLERESVGGWRVEYSANCADVLGFPLVVDPGASAAFSVPISHSTRLNARPRFASDDPSGHYRLVVTSAFWRYDAITGVRSEGLSTDDRRTPRFAIVVR